MIQLRLTLKGTPADVERIHAIAALRLPLESWEDQPHPTMPGGIVRTFQLVGFEPPAPEAYAATSISIDWAAPGTEGTIRHTFPESPP